MKFCQLSWMLVSKKIKGYLKLKSWTQSTFLPMKFFNTLNYHNHKLSWKSQNLLNSVLCRSNFLMYLKQIFRHQFKPHFKRKICIHRLLIFLTEKYLTHLVMMKVSAIQWMGSGLLWWVKMVETAVVSSKKLLYQKKSSQVYTYNQLTSIINL